MKIYVASSWRNQYQQGVVKELRGEGFEVYDFRNPEPGDNGFHWKEIDPRYESWGPYEYQEALEHPLAVRHFQKDWEAMQECDACILVHPCGIDANTEMGWFVGKGKPTMVFLADSVRPGLMLKMADFIHPNFFNIIQHLKTLQQWAAAHSGGGWFERKENADTRYQGTPERS